LRPHDSKVVITTAGRCGLRFGRDYALARSVWHNVCDTSRSGGALSRPRAREIKRADAVVPTRRERCLHPSVLGETTPVAVKIKLKRMGKIHAPFYRIIVADARTKRDGRAIEEIGKYHPMSEPSLIEVDSERAQHWLSVGAQPTDPVRKILEVTGDWQKFKGLPGAEGTLKTAAPKADKKDAYAAAVAEALGTGDSTKGRSGGRRTAGKAADDQAEGDAKASKPSGRAGGRQASGKADTAKADPAKAATAKSDTAKSDTARADTAKSDTARADTAKADTAKADTAKADTAKADTAKSDSAKADTAKADAAKADTAKADTTKADAANDKVDADQAPAAKDKAADKPADKPARASAKKDSAAKAEPADAGEAAEAAATEQGNGA
jgi:small subunit ribosomal protein S16